MRPYWIRFRQSDQPTFLNLGVGVTARSEEDAVALATEAILGLFDEMPEIVEVAVVRDLRDIEQDHVAPNMGNWFERGVWYPRLS